MVISVVGLGLIGASLAKAIKANTPHKVAGFDIDSNVIYAAFNDKTIGYIGDDDILSKSDLIIVALYPGDTIEFVKSKSEIIKKGAIVTDTCGIKESVCNELTKVATDNNFIFIGAHPMAGKEISGYFASSADLFKNAYMILTPIMDASDEVDFLYGLSKEIGFKSVTVSTPTEHDKIIAYTSQLPHVLACAYISDPDATRHDGFSAGSYKDVSRVANINAKMWTELFIKNKDCLTGHIDTLIDNLEKLKTFISSSDHKNLEKMLDDGDKIKKRIG